MSDAFISYSRTDTDFVRRLYQALDQQDRETWVDWQGIDYSTHWWEEICAGIEGADNFVLIVSPNSLNSYYCHREIEHARKHSKRIIPLLYQSIDPVSLVGGWYNNPTLRPIEMLARENWENVQSIQWINLPKLGDFDQALQALLTTIDTDPERTRLHTRLLLRIRDWESRGRSPDTLLHGEELIAYETWLAQSIDGEKPLPTEEQKAYIAASRRAEDERTARIADMERRTRRSQRTALIAGVLVVLALIGAVLAGSSALNATQAQQTTVAGANTADSRLAIANSTLTQIPPTLEALNLGIVAAQEQSTSVALDIMNNRSLFAADLSRQQLASGDPQNALRLALESLKNYPLVFNIQSYDALQSALASPFQQTDELLHEDWVNSARWSADEQRVLSWSADGTVHIWTLDGSTDPLILHHESPLSGAIWSVDEQRVLSWSSDGTVHIWTLDGSADPLILHHEGTVWGAIWSVDEQRVLTWSDDGTVQIWTLDGSADPLILRHESLVSGAIWSADEQRVLSWSADGTARIWTLNGSADPLILRHETRLIGASWSADEQRVLTWSEDGTTRSWNVNIPTLIQIGQSKVINPFNGDERVRFFLSTLAPTLTPEISLTPTPSITLLPTLTPNLTATAAPSITALPTLTPSPVITPTP